MKRPSRLEILEYALEGAQTRHGVWSGAMDSEEESELDRHIAWLEKACRATLERQNAKRLAQLRQRAK